MAFVRVVWQIIHFRDQQLISTSQPRSLSSSPDHRHKYALAKVCRLVKGRYVPPNLHSKPFNITICGVKRTRQNIL